MYVVELFGSRVGIRVDAYPRADTDRRSPAVAAFKAAAQARLVPGMALGTGLSEVSPDIVAPLVTFYFEVEHMPLPMEEILEWLRQHELVRLIEIERTILHPLMDRATLARAIASSATLLGEFTLRSGAVSREYFDKYRFESDPNLLAALAEHMRSLVPPATQVIAGLELGGVPIATALALCTGLPAVFVRKHAKEYGTRQLAEGCDIRGRRVLVVEDVLTSGGQVIASANDLRSLGATVSEAICVIDRESGAAEALAEAGIALGSLFTKTDLRLAAERLSGGPV